MRVIIVAKTRMGGGLCVGAVAEEDCALLRLMPRNRPEHHCWRQFEPQIGHVVQVHGDPALPARIDPPHVEDFLVDRYERTGLRVSDLPAWIAARCRIVEGGPESLFRGLLQKRASGKRFLPDDGPLPEHSVCFWQLPFDLRLAPGEARVYASPDRRFAVTYVGLAPVVQTIPRATLARLSLSRWFQPAGEQRRGCWLQLSGWYLPRAPSKPAR